MLDAFYATNLPETLRILTEKVLNVPEPDELLVNRLLTGLVVLDQEPIPVSSRRRNDWHRLIKLTDPCKPVTARPVDLFVCTMRQYTPLQLGTRGT